MKADKQDIFKKVIKLGADEQPMANFTDSVMQTIDAEAQQEVALKALLQQQPAEGPSFSFTANVMAQITADKKPVFVFQPIISRKVWGIIASVGLVFFVALLLANKPAKPSTGNTWVTDMVSYTHVIPTIYLQGLVIAVILLLGDYLLTKQKAKRINAPV